MNMVKTTKLLMLLALIVFAACTDDNDNQGDSPQQGAILPKVTSSTIHTSTIWTT